MNASASQPPAAPSRPRTSTRERLVEAAQSCFVKYGVAKTSMEDVAKAAGVTRVTVYRHFEGRDQLFLAVMIRDGQRITQDLLAAIRHHDDLEEWVLEALVYLIHQSPGEPLFPMLFSPEARDLTQRTSISAEIVIDQSAPLVEAQLAKARARGVLKPGITAQGLSEWFIRVVMSFLALPGPTERSEQELREYLRTMLPSLTITQDGHPTPTPSQRTEGC